MLKLVHKEIGKIFLNKGENYVDRKQSTSRTTGRTCFST